MHTHTHTIFYFIPKQNKNCYCLVTFKNWKEWCLKKNAINWKHISYIFVRDILNNWNNNKQLDFGGNILIEKKINFLASFFSLSFIFFCSSKWIQIKYHKLNLKNQGFFHIFDYLFICLIYRCKIKNETN